MQLTECIYFYNSIYPATDCSSVPQGFLPSPILRKKTGPQAVVTSAESWCPESSGKQILVWLLTLTVNYYYDRALCLCCYCAVTALILYCNYSTPTLHHGINANYSTTVLHHGINATILRPYHGYNANYSTAVPRLYYDSIVPIYDFSETHLTATSTWN